MQRNKILDTLRFVAIFGVLMTHIDGREFHTSGYAIDLLFTLIIDKGWLGVELFFVLSGFLVSGLIFKEYDRHNSFDPIRFLIRRGFKIYPTYFLWVILAETW